MTDTISKRLHIGGLTPNISPEHLKDRFKSFGTVQDVEWPGPDALGQPRKFAYVSLETTTGQYRKCLNIMSGSTWRGAQLRIAEAKPTYTTRLERERNPTPGETAERLRKRRRRILNIAAGQGVGKEAQDMRMVTRENYTTHKFWTVTPDGTLLRPLAIRPAHPLPSLPSSSSSSSKPRQAPTRARRSVINPSLWSPSHAHLTDSSALPVDGTEWTFEPEEDLEMDEEGFTIIGRWTRSVNGQVVSETVKGRRRPVELDIAESEEDFVHSDAASSTSELFGTRPVEGDRHDSPLFGHRTQATEIPTRDALLGVDADTEQPHLQYPKLSPEPPVHLIALPSRHPPVHLIALPSRHPASPTSPGPSTDRLPGEVRAQIKQEQARDLSILDSILGGADRDTLTAQGGILWFEDSDTDADEPASKATSVLRLRGGAPEESEEEASDSEEEASESPVNDTEATSDTTSTVSDSDSSSNSENTTSDGSDTSTPHPVVQAKSLPTLKDMFTSNAPGTGGSLLAHLGDIEMDESFDLPIGPIHPEVKQPEEEEMFEPAAKARFVPDPAEPLFFPTLQPHQHAKTRDLLSADRENPEFKPFHAQETDTEMKEIWERDKLALTREWKRRHREAKKHRRRKGGAMGDDLD